MNGNKKLKRLIRARMRRTGELYSTARMHVLAEHSSGNSVIVVNPPTPIVEDAVQQLAARVFDFMGDMAQLAEPISEFFASLIAGLVRAVERWAEPVSDVMAVLMAGFERAMEWLRSFLGESGFPMTDASLALPE